MKTSKENLRDTMWKAHKALPSTVRKQSDSALFFQMRHLEPLQNAGVVFLFVGNPPEPETFEWIEYLLNLGKIVAVPFAWNTGEWRHVVLQQRRNWFPVNLEFWNQSQLVPW